MLLAAIASFAHFIAFFALAAALVLELALVSEAMTIATAKRIRRADRVLGIAAIMVLIFGFLRLVYFEKGSDYYFANTFFQIKLGLFLVAGLISLYPTLEFSRWRSRLANGIAPELTTAQVKQIKRIIHWELMLIGGIMLCASLMAKGFGD